MSSLPTTIQVGPYAYRVVLDEDQARKVAVETGNAWVYGGVRHRDLEIVLLPDQAPDAMRDTVLHEVLHTIFNQTRVYEGDEEEKIVSVLCCALLDTLQRNPELVAYLTGGE